MPVKQLRPTKIRSQVRRAVGEMARTMVEGVGDVSVHAVLTCDQDERFAPHETNALRVVFDGWAASLHRTAIPVLVHLDQGDTPATAAESTRRQLQASVNSQWKRHVTAHRAGVAHPYPHDPFGAPADVVGVDHLDGHYLEMLRLHHDGGAPHVRRVYGEIAAMIMARRINGVSDAYEGGSLVGTEISAVVPIGEHATLRKSKLDIDRHLPETVVTAMRGRPLGDFVEAHGIDQVEVWDAEIRPGNPLARGITRHPHTRIHLMRDIKTGIRSFLACREETSS